MGVCILPEQYKLSSFTIYCANYLPTWHEMLPFWLTNRLLPCSFSVEILSRFACPSWFVIAPREKIQGQQQSTWERALYDKMSTENTHRLTIYTCHFSGAETQLTPQPALHYIIFGIKNTLSSTPNLLISPPTRFLLSFQLRLEHEINYAIL